MPLQIHLRRAFGRTALAMVVAVALQAREATATQLCGDADGSASVTTTDAVQALRAAAGLSTTCSNGICDMNVDGKITLTDGIIVLRVAAELVTMPSCPDAQAAGVVDRARGVLEIGVGSIETHAAAARASSAATTSCPDGGTTTDNSNGFTDVECRRGDLVSNGTVTITTNPGTDDFDLTFVAFAVTRLSTGETLATSGTVSFTRDTSGLRFSGSVSRASTLLGTFSDAYTDVSAVDGNAGGPAVLAAGDVTTTVAQGQGVGAFTHVRMLDATIGGPQLAVVIATFDDTSRESFIFADEIGLCDECTSNAECNPQLACRPCVDNCTGTMSRCSVPFGDVGARCVDGLF